ncbi:hypothetical protein ACLOJK_006953 [Asimina triloba]
MGGRTTARRTHGAWRAWSVLLMGLTDDCDGFAGSGERVEMGFLWASDLDTAARIVDDAGPSSVTMGFGTDDQTELLDSSAGRQGRANGAVRMVEASGSAGDERIWTWTA